MKQVRRDDGWRMAVDLGASAVSISS